MLSCWTADEYCPKHFNQCKTYVMKVALQLLLDDSPKPCQRGQRNHSLRTERDLNDR